MTGVTDAKAIMQALSGKTLTNAQMLSISTKYGRARGFTNPWDEETNTTEFAAWPTNEELATFNWITCGKLYGHN
jgi:hypothetical protein